MSARDFLKEYLEKHIEDFKSPAFLKSRPNLEKFFEGVLGAAGYQAKVEIGSNGMRMAFGEFVVISNLHEVLEKMADDLKSPSDVMQLLETVVGTLFDKVIKGSEIGEFYLGLMSQDQVTEMSAALAAQSLEQHDAAVVVPVEGGLSAVPFVMSEKGIVPVSQKMMSHWHQTEGSLLDLAKANYVGYIGRSSLVYEKLANGAFILQRQWPPASALFFFNEFWEQHEERLGAPMMLRIVDGDTLVFAPANDPNWRTILTQDYEITGNAPVISHNVYRWTKQGFKPYRNDA